MKAKDWSFQGYKPDQEDTEAEGIARTDFWSKNKHLLCSPNPAGDNHFHIFISAFNRGIAWALAKYNIQQESANEEPIIVWGIGMKEKNEDYGMLGGPYPTEKEALKFKPNMENALSRLRSRLDF